VSAWKAIAHGPLGRGVAGIAGVIFIIQAVAAPEGLSSRAGASTLVLGAVALWFAAVGHVPGWFRR
jgi:hypothetical protein